MAMAVNNCIFEFASVYVTLCGTDCQVPNVILIINNNSHIIVKIYEVYIFVVVNYNI